MTTTAGTSDRIDRVRSFNRFYTADVGALGAGHLGTGYSLTEARVLYELAHREACEAVQLRRGLGLDASYLSRILARFETGGLIRGEPCPDDARKRRLRLTEKGKAEFGELDRRAAAEIQERLGRLGDPDQDRLVAAMGVVSDLLSGLEPEPAGAAGEPGGVASKRPRSGSVRLRSPEPGELGWVVHRNGVLYADEYGFDQTYEALVARIVADYRDKLDPERENAWIAELDGRPAGAVFCVRHADDPVTTAQLRLLLVEPHARGLGLGSALVEECLRFAREAGYQRIVLWTNDVLQAAARIYRRAGFELLESEHHHSFGRDLTGQYWGRSL